MKRFPAWVAILATTAFGLSSGPGMPEYNDFESVQNTDLVNLATGDFSYSIPVMTVPGPGLGFPIVLNYHAGIQPEQEASWVGLGWNLQAGAITRRVNNVPDEFKGELINEELSSDHIHGWLASIGWNGYTVGLSWDSENGLGGMVGYGVGAGVGGQDSPFSLGAGVTGGVNGVYEGVGITAGLSAGKTMGDARTSAGLTIGVHSKRGTTVGLSAGVSMIDKVGEGQAAITTSAVLANVGVSLTSQGMNAGAAAGVGFTAQSNVTAGVTRQSMGVWIPVWTPWTGYMEANWGSWDVYIDGMQEDHYYGFLYSDAQGMDCVPGSESCYLSPVEDTYKHCKGCDSQRRVKKMDYNISGEYLEIPGTNDFLKLGYTGEDIFSVQTEGISGTFKPYRGEDGDYFTYLSNQKFSHQHQCDGPFGFIGSWFEGTCTRHTDVVYSRFFEGGVNMNDDGEVVNSGGTPIPSRNHHGLPNTMKWRFDSELGGGQYTLPAQRDADPLVAAASTRIEPKYIGTEIRGWVLTNASGVRYVYSAPVMNYAEQSLSSGKSNLSDWTRRETPGYPYAWLLTAILSPDYVKMNPAPCTQISDPGCLPSSGDIGGWVRFDYTDPKTVSWRTPVGAHSTPSSYGATAKGTPASFVTSYSASMGIKSIRYLNRIETPSHYAELHLAEEQRQDGDPPAVNDIGLPLQAAISSTQTGTFDCPVKPGLSFKKYTYNLSIPNPIEGTSVNLVINRKVMYTAGGEFPTCYELDRDIMMGPYVLTKEGDNQAHIQIQDIGQIATIRLLYGNASAEASAAKLSYLDGISLHNKAFGNKEQSAVRFRYDYSLAQGTPNSSSEIFRDRGHQGRLSLRSLQVGATSNGPWNTPYLFAYAGPNPRYDAGKKDYWGYYCQSCSDMRRTPDGSANAWNLTSISMPTGGEIKVEYQPKNLQFSENAPVAFDGDSIGNFFHLQNANFNFSFVDYRTAYRLAMNSNELPIEAATLFAGKQMVFLGRFDLKFDENGEVEADLGTLRQIAGAQYFLEAPTLRTRTSQNFSGRNIGFIGNTGAVSSNRDNCAFGSSCEYYIGRISNSPFGVEKFVSNSWFSPDFPANGFKNPYWIRVWALVDNSEPKPVFFGGGVRVSKLTFREPFSGKENVVAYSYSGGATPSLPQPMSNYSLDIRNKEAVGIRPYLGSPSVIYSKATARFEFPGSSSYSTEYNFITSRDLPVKVKLVKPPGTPDFNLKSHVKILDRSGFWGSLWKMVDSNSSHQVVRVTAPQWTNRIDNDLKTDLGLIGEDLELRKEGKPVLRENDPALQVFSTASDGQRVAEEKYFGVAQKLWSNRFISKECEDKPISEKNKCLVDAKGAHAAQIEVVRVVPIERLQTSAQDGVGDTTEKNLFDYLTGAPLLSIHKNYRGSGIEEYAATLVSPAYHHYSALLDSNMLSQQFSSTHFRFSVDPAGKDFRDLDATDLAAVGSSEITLWGNYGTGSTKTNLYRKSESFVLRDRSGFALPTPAAAATGKWNSQGRVVAYDGFSHIIETVSPKSGDRAAQAYGYGGSLPHAFARHAKRDEIFHESFETKEYEASLAPGQKNRSQVGLRSRTGAKSIRVANCLEQTGGAYVDKPECAETSSSYWKGRMGSSSWFPPACHTDYSPTFGSRTACITHFLLQCGIFRFSCEQHLDPQEPAHDKSAICFDLPRLPRDQTYSASAWYYDQYRGSNPDQPTDPAFVNKTTQVTRPGLSIEASGTECRVENHPNGANVAIGGAAIPAASNTDWNSAQRAMGDSKWKRLALEWTPGTGCAGTGPLQNARICLHASKDKAGSDIYFDEVRVRPKKALMTSYAYDHRGGMISVADENETTRHYQYDGFGNLTGIRNEDGVLLSAQAKRHGDRDLEFFLDMKGEFLDGCEIFDVKSEPVGYDTRFELQGIDGEATYQVKTTPLGDQAHTLCHDPSATSYLRLLMKATGRVKTFTVAGQDPLVIQTVAQHAYNAPFPSAWDGKLYHMKGSNTDAPILGGAFFALHLPTQAELIAMQKIPSNSVLKKYLIKMEILNIPQRVLSGSFHNARADFPKASAPANVQFRMHLRYNYFKSDNVLTGPPMGNSGHFLYNENDKLKWALPSGTVMPGNCFDSDEGGGGGRCFDLINPGETKCIQDGQTAETDCDGVNYPKPGGTFSIRKLLDWPIAYAQSPLITNLPPDPGGLDRDAPLEVVDNQHNYYDADFSALEGMNQTFVFGLMRYFQVTEGGYSVPAEVWGWHGEALTKKDATKKDNISIKISIFPITGGTP